MPTQEFATELRDFFQEAFAVECEIVGDDVIEDICLGRTKFVRSSEGEHFPISEVINGMIAGATLLVALLQLRQELRRLKDSGTPASEVEAKQRKDVAAIKKDTAAHVEPAKQKIAIRRVFDNDEEP
jgi:hypothetical protein